MAKVPNALKDAWDRERYAAAAARTAGDIPIAMHHLERAHIERIEALHLLNCYRKGALP
jgi:hypothetical protein